MIPLAIPFWSKAGSRHSNHVSQSTLRALLKIQEHPPRSHSTVNSPGTEPSTTSNTSLLEKTDKQRGEGPGAQPALKQATPASVPRGEEVQDEEPGTAFLDGNRLRPSALAAQGSGEGRVSWFTASAAVPLMEDMPSPGCVSAESTRHAFP